jgi:hypothetical protein
MYIVYQECHWQHLSLETADGCTADRGGLFQWWMMSEEKEHWF